MSTYLNKIRKQKLWIQTDEYSIEKEEMKKKTIMRKKINNNMLFAMRRINNFTVRIKLTQYKDDIWALPSLPDKIINIFQFNYEN